MKKLAVFLLVSALSLAMVVPAFAETGDTAVTVNVDSSNISVTVPMTMAVTAKVDGGPAQAVPTDYRITNNSAIPVKVDTIAVTLNNATDWAFKNTAIAANAEPTAAGVNDIYMSVNGQVLAVQAATIPTAKTSWNINASSDLDLPIVSSTSRLDQTTTEANLITITYVISAGTHAA